MDMHFPLRDRAPARLASPGQWLEFNALLATVAAAQAASETARAEAESARPRPGDQQPVVAIARLFAPRRGEFEASAVLDGSFDPALARLLLSEAPLPPALRSRVVNAP